MVRRMREHATRTRPLCADGLLQPDLPAMAPKPSAKDAIAAGVDGAIVVDLPARGRMRSWPSGAPGRDSTSSASPPQPATKRGCRRSSQHAERLSLLRRDHRYHWHKLGRCRRCIVTAVARLRRCAVPVVVGFGIKNAGAEGRRRGARPPTPRWSPRPSSIVVGPQPRPGGQRQARSGRRTSSPTFALAAGCESA